VQNNKSDKFMMTKNHHNSVMFSESIDGLDIHPNGIYVDTTFGRG